MVFFQDSRQNCARRIGPLALVLGLLLLWLVPTHSMAQQAGQLIQEINVSGNRKTPKETIKARIYTREGDVYDEAALQRDLRSVWNTGYFDDVRIEREQTTKGWDHHVLRQ